MSAEDQKLRTSQGTRLGTLFVIVGPSGVGKDTVIDWLRRNHDPQAPIVFARRTITRAADAGGEEHFSISQEDFDALSAADAFSVTWQAHGLSYGIPAGLQREIERGNDAVINGSRHALPAIAAAFPNVFAIKLTVEKDELAKRLTMRGRESEEAIQARLSRPEKEFPGGIEFAEIDNSGPVERAGQKILQLLASRH